MGLVGTGFPGGAVNGSLLVEPPGSVSLWLFKSPRELSVTCWEGLGIAAIFLETKWWQRVGVTVSACRCWPNPSVRFRSLSPTSCAESLSPETYILYVAENVSWDTYLLPGWRGVVTQLFRVVAWSGESSYFLKEVNRSSFILALLLLPTSSNASKVFWEFCGINWISLGFLHCQFKIQLCYFSAVEIFLLLSSLRFLLSFEKNRISYEDIYDCWNSTDF